MEIDIEKVKETLFILGLGLWMHMVFFIPLILICTRVHRIFSERVRFFIALLSGYSGMLFTQIFFQPFTGSRNVVHLYYLNAPTVTFILAFMLVCFRLRKAEKIRNDHRFLMYLLILYAGGYLVFYYAKLLKWNF
jgi:hypothetical protein